MTGTAAFTAARPPLLSLLAFTAVVLGWGTIDSFGGFGIITLIFSVLAALAWAMAMLITALGAAWRRAWLRSAFTGLCLLAAALVALAAPRAGTTSTCS